MCLVLFVLLILNNDVFLHASPHLCVRSFSHIFQRLSLSLCYKIRSWGFRPGFSMRFTDVAQRNCSYLRDKLTHRSWPFTFIEWPLFTESPRIAGGVSQQSIGIGLNRVFSQRRRKDCMNMQALLQHTHSRNWYLLLFLYVRQEELPGATSGTCTWKGAYFSVCAASLCDDDPRQDCYHCFTKTRFTGGFRGLTFCLLA